MLQTNAAEESTAQTAPESAWLRCQYVTTCIRHNACPKTINVRGHGLAWHGIKVSWVNAHCSVDRLPCNGRRALRFASIRNLSYSAPKQIHSNTNPVWDNWVTRRIHVYCSKMVSVTWLSWLHHYRGTRDPHTPQTKNIWNVLFSVLSRLLVPCIRCSIVISAL